MKRIIALKILLFLAVGIVLTSCATLLSGQAYVMSIESDLPDASIRINDESTFKLPAKIAVTRSKKDLAVSVLQNESVINETILEPKIRHSFIGQVFYGDPYFIFDLLIDSKYNKRYTYGDRLNVDSLGNIENFIGLEKLLSNRYADLFLNHNKKGNINLLVSNPAVDFYRLAPIGEPIQKRMSAVLGLGVGGEYFYKDNKSLQLKGDAFALVSFGENYPSYGCSAQNVSLTDNLYRKRFSFGYGLNYAKNTFVSHAYSYYSKPLEELEEGEEPVLIDVEGYSKTNNLLGLALNMYYRFTNNFYLGVVYRPSFLELSKLKMKNEHTVSIDLTWKINLKK
ncbi:MAG: hypothetical protein LBS52_01450 [Dysgonamonadaceae bacterium]|jgi:hypothetical protein|nr:hypothetical protein [Dysgonamonadaceae bacterium]